MSTPRLVSVLAENVKRVRFIQIDFPEQGVFEIGGGNDNGKTSLLDAIEMATTGGRSIPERPIRDGASKARIVLDCADFKVLRTFTKSGSSLEVRGPDGKPAASPQALLDKFFGKFTMDPLRWYGENAKKQGEVLRELVGIKWDALDNEVEKLTEERKALNAQIKKDRVIYEALPRFGDVPRAPLNMQALLDERDTADTVNDKNAKVRQNVRAAEDHCALANTSIEQAQAEVTRAEAALKAAQERLAERMEARSQRVIALEELRVQASALVDVDVKAIREKLTSIEATNAKVAANAKANASAKEIADKEEKAERLSARIDEIAREKERQLAAAKFPIEGLSCDDVGVLYNGVPLVQHGAATKMRIAVALAFAQNPGIKLALVRDASLLDKKSMALLAEIAAEHNALVLCERVGDDAHVVLEDGMLKVAGDEAEAEGAGASA